MRALGQDPTPPLAPYRALRETLALYAPSPSHGCIRVADPVGLAEWILAPDGWSRERIVSAMDGLQTVAVNLSQPVGVAIFSDDIYGHDASLHQALERLCAGNSAASRIDPRGPAIIGLIRPGTPRGCWYPHCV